MNRKKLLAILVGSLIGIAGGSALAGLRGSPFQPHDDQRFDEIEGGNSAVSATEGVGVKSHIALAQWDYSIDGAASSVGDYDLGVGLPANALITKAIMFGVNAASSTHTSQHEPTLALKCGSTEIMAAQQLALRVPAVDFAHDIVAGTSATFIDIPAKCNLTATVATGDFTAGRVQFLVEFIVHQ